MNTQRQSKEQRKNALTTQAHDVCTAAVALAALLLTSGTAQAAVDIGINQNFIGAAPQSSTTPWVNLLFSDIGANTVRLTITAPNLTGSELLDTLRMNFNPTKNVSALTFTPVYNLWQGLSTGSGSWDYATGEDKFKANHAGGMYDINLAFTGANPFNGGDQAVFDIKTSQTGTGLTSQDFAFLSTGSPGSIFYGAANIGLIGGNKDGWEGATTFTVLGVPEPASGFTAAACCLVGLIGFIRSLKQVDGKHGLSLGIKESGKRAQPKAVARS